MPYTSVKLNQIVSTKHVVILRWNSPIKQPHKCFLYGRSEAFKCKQGFWIVLLTFMWPRHWSHFLSSLVDVMVEYRPTIFCQTPYSTLKIYFLYTLRWYSCVFVCLFSEWCTMKWVTQRTSVRIWRSSEWSWRAVIFCWTPVRRLYGRVRHTVHSSHMNGAAGCLIAGHFLFKWITTPILHEVNSFLFVSLCSTLLVPFSTSWSKITLWFVC